VTLKLLTSLASLVLLAAPSFGGEALREQSQRDIDARGFTSLRVENPRGVIHLKPSADGRIHLTALKIVRSAGRERAARLARETQVVLSTEDRACVLRVRYPQRQSVRISFWEMFSGFELPAVGVQLTLEVPTHLAVTLRTTSGDLESEGFGGAQELLSTSGDVNVVNAGGPLRAESTSGDVAVSGASGARLRTVSGDVSAEQLTGTLDAHTTSGRITVRGPADSVLLGTVSGDIQVERAARGALATTTSGDIEVRGASGVVRLGTSSGDISVRLMRPLARADLSSGSGDIDVRIADELGCDIEMRTSNGTLDASVPLEVATLTRHLVTGRVRKGGTPVSLRSSSGDIHLMGGGN
jgi:hypothetical protein